MMKFMSFNKLLRAGAALALLTGVASTELSANTIDMVGYNGSGDKVTCAPMCSGFLKDFVSTPPLVWLSETKAHKFSKKGDFVNNLVGQTGDTDAELAILNALLVLFDDDRPAVTYVNKPGGSTRGFSTSLQYFSIKQSDDWFFFENNSGGSLTVELTSGTDSYSHWTEYGPSVSAVPVPAAVWLFGSALIGLVGFSKRRKAA